MEKTDKNESEILKMINSEGTIVGTVEMNANDLLSNTEGIDYINEIAPDLLVGENYGYLIQDISYRIVGVDIKNQTVSIEVTGDANDIVEKIKDIDE